MKAEANSLDVESYKMVATALAEPEGEQNMFESTERTLIVKRLDLTFSGTDCQLITFTDITAFQNLEKEKKISQMLKMLNRSVSHEMLGPLNSNVQLTNLLLQTSLDPN